MSKVMSFRLTAATHAGRRVFVISSTRCPQPRFRVGNLKNGTPRSAILPFELPLHPFHATPMSHSSHKKQSSTLFRAVSFTLLFTHHHGADDTKCTAALRARRHWSETDRSQYTSLSQSNIIVTLNCGGFVVELLSSRTSVRSELYLVVFAKVLFTATHWAGR